EIVNFDFLKNYGFCVKLSYGKGTISKIPWIIFIRTDTQEYKASYGIYVYCGIKRENGEIIVCIGESEDKTINYLAKNKVDDYNTQFNKKTYDYKNLNNDIDLIIDKIIENMQWFAKLPLNEIQDRNDLSKSNNKEIRNDGSEMSNKKENKNLSLNQILYGPPGTGKTYHTIDKALEILGENLESRDRDEKKAKFDEYVKDGQIVFTTFHQSYGYEEFVEGIKPMMNNEANSQEIQYEIKDGIFKDICNRALENYENSNLNTEELREKIKLREKVEKFLNRLLETNEPISKTKGGNFFINSFNNNTIEIYSEDVERFDGIFKLSLSTFITLLKSNIEFNSAVEMFKKVFDRDYADRTHTYYFNLVNKFKEYEKQAVLKTEDNKISSNSLNSYIIIIDEINRGNVSKIFGELITLIEPSKRIGESEELKVTLPYSGEKFGVPKNVYIIGTMNTADRSITSLDTALRRRFEFVEMMPDPDLLKNVFICKDVENPNKDEDYLGDDAKTEGFAEILQNILISINKRIEFLLDREKTIGHAFFMSEAVKFNKDNWCKSDEYEEDWYVLSISKLKSIFQNKIIPLLQEYFYNDYALISAVLNDNGMIEKCEKDDKYLQKIKNLDNVDSEKIIYNIASFDNKIWNDIKTYQAIYNDGENQSKNDKQ
ncbi:AAA family ATPase, partial [Campylobacter coli]|nr:AAA family ATPase [Campylobacter coli]EHZ5411295.1 AAA family ATPase [Campylobacter jejuni]EDC4824794.1 AAA domain-containing protein [Campylobacter coli]EDO9155614.1 AAA domain-containing protein [Campylobacter coli]EHV6715704.1 AAA family ATPase [Campylobacter coli]